MKKLKLYTLVLTGCLYFMTSCTKDQSFDTNEINELTISTVTANYSVKQLDRLVIDPQITESLPSGENYSYEWKAYRKPVVGNAEAITDFKILSTERKFDTPVELAPGPYNLMYSIINNTTGARFTKLFDLTVTGAFYKGWLIAHNKGGNAELSFIQDKTVYMSPFEEINNITFPGRSVASFFSNQGDVILYFTSEGVYRFNANDFSSMGQKAEVIDKPSFDKVAYGVGFLQTDQYIVADGGIHVGVGTGVNLLAEILKPFSDRVTGDYDAFPAAMTSNIFGTYFYDNKNKRFMMVSYTERKYTTPVKKLGDAWDVSNVGKTMIAQGTGAGGIDYFVMEDASARYVYAMRYSYPENGIPTSSQTVNAATSPEFNAATSFAVSGLYPIIYYAVGNKIYMYNIIANSAELIYQFSAGSQVKKMRVDASTNRNLLIGIDNGSEGEVYYFDLDSQGKFASNTYNQKYTGFGEITDVSFR